MVEEGGNPEYSLDFSEKKNPNLLDNKYQTLLTILDFCGGEAYLEDLAPVISEKGRESDTIRKLDELSESGYVRIYDDEIGEYLKTVYQLNSFEDTLNDGEKEDWVKRKKEIRGNLNHKSNGWYLVDLDSS